MPFLVFSTSLFSILLFPVILVIVLMGFNSLNNTILLQVVLCETSSHALEVSLLLDFTSLALLCTVTWISASVFLFSFSYLKEVTYFKSFHLTLFLFVLSMSTLVLSPNLMSVLLGWDGLGLSSYLLVMFYANPKSLNASLITLLSNRVGDGILLILMVWLIYHPSPQFMFWKFSPLTNMLSELEFFLSVLFIIAAMTKSAQVPFSAWLPAAMAAPTPVSSLVHSSTLVTAGVYILVRLGELPELGHMVLITIGSLTSLIAGLSALFEMDMKKIIALSTLSQLGVMFCALGLKSPVMAFCHLLAHAFFKAMLFITAGHLIHAFASYQDFRTFGAGLTSLPLSAATVLISKISLMGLPFFSACFSKEVILEALSSGQAFANSQLVTLNPSFVSGSFYLAALLTAGYSARFIFLLFISYPQGGSPNNFQDPDLKTTISILWLMLPALFGGWGLFPFYALLNGAPLVSSSFKIIFLFSVVSTFALGGLLTCQTQLTFEKCPSLINLMNMPMFSGLVPNYIFNLSGIYYLVFFSQNMLDCTFASLSKSFDGMKGTYLVFFSSSLTRFGLVVVLWLILVSVFYLCILPSLKIQNFMWLHPYMLKKHQEPKS